MLKQIRVRLLHRLQLRESWIIFFILGMIMMNFPFLHIFNKPVTIAGFPLLFLYFTVGWAVSIGVIFLFTLAVKPEHNPDNHEKKEP